MKLVQTLLVRDEVDIVGAQIAYHLNAGVDFVVAIDHESKDGTTDVLESFARDGYLRRIPEEGDVKESRWRTEMARLAASEHGADWVINTDVDEFWIPRRGTLKETFASVELPYGVVWGLSRHFPPRPGDGALFAERMTARVSSSAPLNDPSCPYRPHAKVAHRGDPEVVISRGGHAAYSRRFLPIHHWHAAEIFHFPFRSLEQYERKGTRGARMAGWTRLAQYDRIVQASEEGRLRERFEALVVDDETLACGVAAGSLVVDTRLRDALRRLGPGLADRSGSGPGTDGHGFGGGSGSEARTGPEASDAGSTAADPSPATAVLDPALIAEAAALREADVVRLARAVDGLDSRLRRVERRPPG